MMYLLFTFLTLSTSGLYLYYCDKGDLFMKIVWMYEFIKTYIIKPLTYATTAKGDITEVYKNNVRTNVRELFNCRSSDVIEILWKGRYRTVYKGKRVEFTCPFNECNEKRNILYASLHRQNIDGNVEEIDITNLIDQYSGPNGDFFQKDVAICNKPENFFRNEKGVRVRVLNSPDDYISVLDKCGNEIQLRL